MNGWTPDEINRIEATAAKSGSLWERAAYLHRNTGLGWHVCIAWAHAIKRKFKLLNGDD
jgi:hypothetical protein